MRKNIKLYNISYDPQKKLVKSFYEGGVRSVHHKALHKWKNDSLIIVEKVELNFGHQSIETKYYKEINGKFINYKTENDSTENHYENALFDYYY